ncbi:hypothetical protein [Turicibacter sanguinis]
MKLDYTKKAESSGLVIVAMKRKLSERFGFQSTLSNFIEELLDKDTLSK